MARSDMAIYYVDTSALVKVYVAEVGHGWMQALSRPKAGNALFVSQLTSIELEVALFRKAMERSIADTECDKSIGLFRQHLRQRYSVIPITDEVCNRARLLIHTRGLAHPLRTYDAMHLASAQIVSDTLVTLGVPALSFVAADQRLLAIAQNLGFATDNPEDHP